MFVYLLRVIKYFKPIHLYLVKVRPCAPLNTSFLSTRFSMLLDLPWLPLLQFAFIFMIAPCLSLSPPRPPITCLSTRLCVSLQTEFTIFASFSKPQAWLRGAVVEIVQVCSFTFFRGLSFHESTFSDAAVG